MKRILSTLILAAALLASPFVTSSCDPQVEVVVTDFVYSVSVGDVPEGTAAECLVSLVKGGTRNEPLKVNYKIDDDLSLRVSVNGREITPGETVTLDATGTLRIALPVLPAGPHMFHVILTNQYGISAEKDIKFFVIHEKVYVSEVVAPERIRMEMGSPVDTAVSIEPANADILTLTASAANADIAAVSLSGDGAVKRLRLEPLSVGTTTVTFTHEDIRGQAAATAIEVFQYVISGLSDTMTMTEGATSTVTLSVDPATSLSLVSSSSCVTVTGAGASSWTIKAVEPGISTLTATAGNTKATCVVTVDKKPETIAVSPMSAVIPYGQTWFFSVVSSADFSAELSGSAASVTERTSTGVTVRNDNPSFEDARLTLTLINAADPTKKAVADLLLERKPETLSMTETLSEAGRAFWSVTGENKGWELVSAPAGLKAEVSGNTIVLTNTTYKGITGELKIRTKLQGVEVSRTVTVRGLDVVLQTISADPSSFSVEEGKSISVALTGSYTDGSDKDLTNVATWTQSQNLSRNGNSFTATDPGSAWIRASYGGQSVTIDGTVTAKPVTMTALIIDPTSFSALVDESRIFSVTASLSDGTRRDVTRDCEWSATGGAQELGKGYYKMTDMGEVLIEATYTFNGATMTARARGSVTKPSGTVTGVTIDPKTASLMIGDAVSFTGAVRYSDGTSDASGSFTVSPAGILSGGDGSYVAVAEGTATVTYSYSGYSASATAIVSRNGGGGGSGSLIAVTLNNSVMTLYVGREGALTAVAKYSNGSATDVTAKAIWSSSNTAVATVDATGRIQALKAGVAVISAEVDGIKGSCTVTVEEDVVLSGISLTPPSLSVTEGDSPKSISAKGYWSDGTSKDLTFLGTWSSSNESVASVSGGTVSFGSAGSATITCSYQGKSANASVTVSRRQQVTTRIDLNTPAATLSVGETLQIDGTVYCEYPTRTYSAKSVCTWSSSNSSVASVSSSGLVTARSTGSAVITAANNGVTATCSITVKAAPVTYSSLRLNSSTLTMAVGGKYYLPGDLRATAVFSDGTTRDVTASVQWSLASNSYVSLSGTTLSANKASGSSKATLTASYTYSGTTKSASVSITVTEGGQGEVQSISASPSSVDIAVGGTLSPASRFTVTATFSDGSMKNVTSDCSWEISSQYTNYAYMNGSTIMTRNAGTARLTIRYKTVETYATINVTAKDIPVTGVTLNKSNITLTEGASTTLTPTVKPDNATNTAVTWSSSNASVATCTNGRVVAIQAGTCVITCKTQDGGYTAQCNVTVNPKGVDVTGVSVSPTTAEVEVGATVTLRATVTPSNATNKSVSWESSDSYYATVDASGNVTGKKPGSVIIYAISDDNANIKGSCQVTVKAKTVAVTGVEIYKGSDKVSSITVNTGQPVQLTAKVLPENATNKDVTWTSADPSVITVDASGLVSAKTGTSKPVDVTVKTADGGKTATVKVTGVQLQYSITADPAKLEWAYDKIDTKSTTLTLVNIDNVTAELKSGSQYFNSPALESVSGKLRLSISPKQANTTTSPRSGVIRVADVKDATHYTEITVTQAARTAPYVDQLVLSPSSVSVKEKTSSSAGGTAGLSLSARDQYGAGIDPGSVKWHSGDSKTATVSDGTITGVKAGTTTIWASVTNANNVTVESNRVNVTVTAVSVAVTAVSLNKSSMTLEKGKGEQLTATLEPSDASNKSVSWSSSNSSVASVDGNGYVTANGYGNATITVKTADGGKTATCAVKVPEPVSGVSVSPSSHTFTASNNSVTIKVTVTPSNAQNVNVTPEYNSSIFTVTKVKSEGAVHTYTIAVRDGVLNNNSGDYSVTFKSDENSTKSATVTCTLKGDATFKEGYFKGKTSYDVQCGGMVDIGETHVVLVRDDSHNTEYDYPLGTSSGWFQYATVTAEEGGSLVTVSKADQTFKVYANDSNGGTVKLKVTITIPEGGSPWAHGTVTVKGYITVNVTEVPTVISFSKSEYTINTGETLSVTATVENQKDKPVTWSSSVPGIVSMTTAGNTVTLKGEVKGSTKITATCNGASASFTVIVRDPDQPVLVIIGLEPQVSGQQVKILATLEDEATGEQRIVDVTKDVVVTIATGSKDKLTVTKSSPSVGEYVLIVRASQSGTYYFTVKYTTAEGASDSLTLTVTLSGGKYTIR